LDQKGKYKMICLTGDIHHSSLKTKEQKFLSNQETEVKITLRFLKIIEKYGIKVTFFITGKTFDEEWDDLKDIVSSKLVEVGGHTYNGIPAGQLYKMWCRITKGYTPTHSPNYGTPFKQKIDIKRTLDIVKRKTGSDLISWRSHGYIHDNNTYRILFNIGVKLVSDQISASILYPYKIKDGLISVPINVIPDHDHIYHAHRNVSFVEKAKASGYGKDDFGIDSYDVKTWGEIVKKQVAEIDSKNGLATILMHPLCMYLSDEFKTAEQLLKFLSKFNTIWMKDILSFGIYK